jgi:hypothetical protein
MQATQYFNSPAPNGQSSHIICHPKAKMAVHAKNQTADPIILAGMIDASLDVITKDGALLSG